MTVDTWIIAGASVLQAGFLWRLVVAHRSVSQLEARMARHGEALSLLTDTSESGFAAVARELERLSAPGTKTTRRASTRRVTGAARKGRKVSDIAAAEQMSEGEVRLRLQLAGYEADERPAGALRA